MRRHLENYWKRGETLKNIYSNNLDNTASIYSRYVTALENDRLLIPMRIAATTQK